MLGFVTVLMVLVVVVGCRRKSTPPPAKKSTSVAMASASASASAKVIRGRPKSQAELPTTSADIYLENLDGQIAELTRLGRAQPGNAANRRMLSAAHHVRGRFRGDLDEIQQGIELASECVKLAPDSAPCLLMRAEQQQTLHRFAAARADLARARALGADPSSVADLEAELDWNDGRYEAAIAAIRRARRERPSSSTWLREAQLDHDLAREAEADAAFEAAGALVTDPAPLPLAHLYVQRGIHEVAHGRLEAGVVFFREATARLPTYVAAQEHLAETLADLGRDEEAIAIYERVVELSDDPEFSHALASLYAKHGRSGEAAALEATARQRYEKLLEVYPEAMYWHASEFFAETGDHERALALLRKNVLLRPNSASHVALAKAELAAGHVAEARVAIDKALAMPVRAAALDATAAEIYRRGGDAPAADRFLERARHINPRL